MSMMEKLELMEQIKRTNRDRLIKAGLVKGVG